MYQRWQSLARDCHEYMLSHAAPSKYLSRTVVAPLLGGLCSCCCSCLCLSVSLYLSLSFSLPLSVSSRSRCHGSRHVTNEFIGIEIKREKASRKRAYVPVADAVSVPLSRCLHGVPLNHRCCRRVPSLYLYLALRLSVPLSRCLTDSPSLLSYLSLRPSISFCVSVSLRPATSTSPWTSL